MSYRVNDNCIGCGLCAGICPEGFELRDDGLAEATEFAGNAETEPAAREAMLSCPVVAIEEE